MIELLGASAVSDFRIAKLRPALEAIHPGIGAISARFVHFVDLERDRLEAARPGEEPGDLVGISAQARTAELPNRMSRRVYFFMMDPCSQQTGRFNGDQHQGGSGNAPVGDE